MTIPRRPGRPGLHAGTEGPDPGGPRVEASGRCRGQARDGGEAAAGGRADDLAGARGTYRSGGGGGGGGGPGGGGRLLVVVARRWRPYLAAGSGQQSER